MKSSPDERLGRDGGSPCCGWDGVAAPVVVPGVMPVPGRSGPLRGDRRTSAAKTAQVTLLQSDNTGQATGGEALRVKATTPLGGSCRGVVSHPHRHCHTPTSKYARGTSVIAINAAAGRH